MPAVVRVKRRIDEEPLSAFVLNSKRRRVDDNGAAAAVPDEATASGLTNKEELSTLLKFAGTISEQDDSATTQFARLTKEEARDLVLRKTRKPVNTTEKARKEMRQHLQEQRFRVVNCLRTTLEDNENNGNASRSKEITIVDIEKQNTNDKTVFDTLTTLTPLSTSLSPIAVGSNEASTSAAAAAAAAAAAVTVTATSSSPPSSSLSALTMTPSDSDTGYVYDLYIPDSEQHADYVDLLDENYLSVRPFDDLVYEDRYNNDDDDDDNYDSEDSNQENYFGNEYPDEDDDKAMYYGDPDATIADDEDDEDDPHNLAKGLDKFVFGDDDDECESMTSSDDDGNYYNAYRDPYVHSIDADEENFCADVDSCDVDRYGLAYARYKARILKKNKVKVADEDDDEDEDADDNDVSVKRDMDDSSSDSCDYNAYYDAVTEDHH